MSDLDKYLNDDIIGEINTYISHSDHIKILQEKTRQIYIDIIKKGVIDSTYKFEVGDILFESSVLLKYIKIVDTNLNWSSSWPLLCYYVITHITRCYITYDIMKVTTCGVIESMPYRKEKIKPYGGIKLSYSLMDCKICVKKYIHLKYILEHKMFYSYNADNILSIYYDQHEKDLDYLQRV